MEMHSIFATDSSQSIGQLELARCWEIESGSQIEDFQGRLKAYMRFWEKNLEPAF